MLPDLGCRHALLLQGPAGPFFRRFAEDLREAGIDVTKVNLHAGDRLFYPGPDALDYRGTREEWPDFVRDLFRARDIDAVFLFGDCRPYHRAAIEVAEELGAGVWVFEEGYLRPDYITLERHGVNGNSRLPKDPEFYLAHAGARSDGSSPEVIPVGRSYGVLAWYSTLSAWAFTYRNGDFAHYEHHRPLNMWQHTGWHVRGWARKAYFGLRERGLTDRFTGELSNRYFLVPLQVHSDYQLVHSPYDEITDFIRDVVRDFARHGPPDHAIVFKHHPVDRPYREYGALFRELTAAHGLEDRLFYVHDLHLPTLLKHAAGTITINSTVGLSSLHHRTPVKVLGEAIYDLPGLTHQGELSDFLRAPGEVDEALYRAFRAWLELHYQANGSFFRRLPGSRRGTGIRWFAEPPPVEAALEERTQADPERSQPAGVSQGPEVGTTDPLGE